MAACGTTAPNRWVAVAWLMLLHFQDCRADMVRFNDVLVEDDACMSKIMQGSIGINGLSGRFHMAGTGGNAQGDRMTVQHDAGFSLFSRCETEWVPDGIAQFSLLGKTLSFTVDLSKVGCACNLAVYLISSPAFDTSGRYSRGTDRGGQPPYYCDANRVGGQWCPEIDLMEANNHAFQATPHRCGASTGGHYQSCDRGGCAQNTHTRQGSYGPGEQYTIDTRDPFQVETEFVEEGEKLVGMRTTLRQLDRTVVLAHESCNQDYMAALSDAMGSGMSLRITYWGGSQETMAWMDKPPCGSESCGGANAGEAVISAFTVSPPEQSGFAASEGISVFASEGQWISDTSAPWQCHLDVGDEAEHQWCRVAGFQDGYEFQYNAGEGSPCGGCWCCKRAAKPRAASVDAVEATAAVWVISDPQDPMNGQQVPQDAGYATVFMRKFDADARPARASLAFGTLAWRDVEAALIVGAAACALVVGAVALASRRLHVQKPESCSRASVASVCAANCADAATHPETPGGTGTTPMMRSDNLGSPTVPSLTPAWRSPSPFFPNGFVDEDEP